MTFAKSRLLAVVLDPARLEALRAPQHTAECGALQAALDAARDRRADAVLYEEWSAADRAVEDIEARIMDGHRSGACPAMTDDERRSDQQTAWRDAHASCCDRDWIWAFEHDHATALGVGR